MHKGKKAKVKH